MVEVVVVMGIAWFNMGSRVNDLEYWGAAHQSIYCHSALDPLPWAKLLSGWSVVIVVVVAADNLIDN